MEKEQIFKTNKVILIMHSIISTIMILGLLYELTQPTFNAVTFVVRMVLVLGSYVVGVVLFVRNKTKNIYSWCSSIGFSVVYAVYLFLGGSLSDIFPYYIVLMMCYVLTMNTALVRTTSGILLVINIARCVMSLVTAHNMPNVYKDVFFQLIVTVLVCLAAVMGQKLMKDFMQSFADEVLKSTRKQQAVSEKILTVATDVEKSAESIYEGMDRITGSTETVNESMGYVSKGVDNMVDAIGDQTQRTADIQEIIGKGHEEMDQMVEITDRTKKALDEGAKAMDNLFNSVKSVMEENDSMKASADQLRIKTDEIRGITDIILGISSQTNLLALNASIEAARAGEQGKGFAVVADEIRNLADQTRQETENITTLIDDLSAETNGVVEKVQNSVSLSQVESDAAKTANDHFTGIQDYITELGGRVGKVSEHMQNLYESNNRIVDSVNTLSSTSEEISASAQDVAEASDKNVNLVNDFINDMTGILDNINSLKEYTHDEETE